MEKRVIVFFEGDKYVLVDFKVVMVKIEEVGWGGKVLFFSWLGFWYYFMLYFIYFKILLFVIVLWYENELFSVGDFVFDRMVLCVLFWNLSLW